MEVLETPQQQQEQQRRPATSSLSYFSTLPADTFQRLLSFLDGGTCKEVCMRPVSPLQEISRPYFFHLFIGNALVLQFDPERKKIYVGKRTSLEHVTDVLRYFGPYLEQLYFYTSSLSHRYFSLVLRHCTPGRLSTVHLSIPEDVDKVLPSIRSSLSRE